MSFLKQKLKLFRNLTNYTYPQIADRMMGVGGEEIRGFIKNQKSASEEFNFKFYRMLLDEFETNPSLALYPELFLPLLPGIFAIISHEGKWFWIDKGDIEKTPEYKDDLPELLLPFLPPLPVGAKELVLCQNIPYGWDRNWGYSKFHNNIVFGASFEDLRRYFSSLV